MTLAEELSGKLPHRERLTGTIVDYWDRGFRLPFDGRLSEEEQRLINQGWFKSYSASWADEDVGRAIDRAVRRWRVFA